MKRSILILCLSLFSIVAFGQIIERSDLSYKKGVYYQKSTKKPFTGVAIVKGKDGQLLSETHYENGVEQGLDRRWHDNGQLKYQANRESGELDGEIKGWYENGAPEFLFIFDKGVETGYHRNWHDNGQLRSESFYQNGKKEGPDRSWYENGSLSMEVNYSDGKETGQYRMWYPNGQLETEQEFVNGKLDGVSHSWFESGQMECETYYQKGKSVGTGHCWHENGQLAMQASFKNDDFDGLAQSWDENGTLTDETCFRKSKKTKMSYCRKGAADEDQQTNKKRSAKSGTLKSGVYVGPNKVLSVKKPRPANFAGVPYEVETLDNRGDDHYDKVMFHVGDFGEYLVAGARYLPPAAVDMMEQDGRQTALIKASEASLFGWRSDLEDLPEITEESFFESQYGETLRRVYRAQEGSLLARMQFKGGEAITSRFDTNIVSIVAWQGPVMVYVIAQDDQAPDDSAALIKKAGSFFEDIEVLPE